MERKEFLSLIGMTVGAFTIGNCMQACKKISPAPAAPVVDFTLNLSDPAYVNLTHNGGFLYNSGVIIAKTMTGTFIAVSEYCTHQGSAVVYQSAGNNFYCNSHGAAFSSIGAVTNGPAATSLKQYTTTLTGNMLRVNG